MTRIGLLLAIVLTLCASPSEAQTVTEKQALQKSLAKLSKQLDRFPENQRVDAEVCAKAVEWLLRHDEFFKPGYVDLARTTLELGTTRLEFLNGSSEWWNEPGTHALGYRSKIDRSVQPYVVILPETFRSDEDKLWPVHVVLHGRNKNLTEAQFIASQNGNPAPKEQQWIELHVFGRTNNAYRWAGETDVFEALDDVIRRYPVDEQRITLWGFSMGGAGAWHLGLHHPTKWASVGAGAGFVDFYRYQKQAEQLPSPQHQLLTIYDVLDVAANLSAVPFITYGGELDPQLQSSLMMKEAAEQAGVPLKTIVGPQMGHKFDPASKQAFIDFLVEHNSISRDQRTFDFVTYTLKYNRCGWLTIHEQLTPYALTEVKSSVDETGQFHLTTSNVAALSVQQKIASQIVLDQTSTFDLSAAADSRSNEVCFVRSENGSWTRLNDEEFQRFLQNPDHHKRHNLQGPIDDAFMEPFVCVTGTRKPWSKELSNYTDSVRERFVRDFDKWMRAIPPVVEDSKVTEEMIRDHHLILFGDPSSNRLLKRVADRLPVEWSKRSFTFRGKTYPTDNHALAIVYPNPLNPQKYVVINTGMTLREEHFKASNSWLFPKLGDYAVIRFTPKATGGYEETVIENGVFDSSWSE